MIGWMIENTVVAGTLAVLVFGICAMNRKRPALCHGLWVLVLVRLVVPPLPWVTPLSAILSPVSHRLSQPVALGDPLADRLSTPKPDANLEATKDPAVDRSVDPVAAAGDANAPVGNEGDRRDRAVVWSFKWSASELLILIWILGALIVASVQVRGILAMRHLLATGQPAPDAFRDQVDGIARLIGSRVPQIRLVDRVGAPFVWALGRPVLVWPRWALAESSDVGERAMMAHELAHIARGDHFVRWLELIIGCMAWWNPVFWVARSQIRLHSELACDASALRAFPKQRKAFATALLNAASRGFYPSKAVTAMGATARGRRKLERRLKMIMTNSVTRGSTRRWIVVAALAQLMLLPGWSPAPVAKQVEAPAELGDIDRAIQARAGAAVACERGARLMRAEQYAEAVAAFEEAVNLQPDHDRLKFKLAQAALEAGQAQRAIAVLESIGSLGHWFKIDMVLAQAYAANGDRSAALSHLNDAVRRGAIDSVAFADDVFGDLVGDAEFSRLMQLSLKLDAVDQKRDKGDEQVLDDLDRHLKIAPDDAEGWGRLGYFAISMGQLDRAEQAFLRQLELRPDLAKVHYNLACTYARKGRVKVALRELERSVKLGWDDDQHMANDSDLDALREEPAYIALHDRLARETEIGDRIRVAMKQGDNQLALQLLGEVETLPTIDASDRVWIAGRRGNCQYNMKNYAQAAQSYIDKIAFGTDLDMDTDLYNIACCKALSGEAEQALAYLRVAVEAGFDSAGHMREDSDLASLRDDPRFQEIVRRAMALDLTKAMGIASWEAFVGEFDQQLATDALSEDRIEKLARALYNGGAFELGAKAFVEQHERGYSLHTAAYNAACCFALSGDGSAAMQWLAQAVEDGFVDADHFASDDDLDSLRQRPEFQAMIEALE